MIKFMVFGVNLSIYFLQDFEGYDIDGLCDKLRLLATDSQKFRAKKDRRQQRSSFRDILKAIEVKISYLTTTLLLFYYYYYFSNFEFSMHINLFLQFIWGAKVKHAKSKSDLTTNITVQKRLQRFRRNKIGFFFVSCREKCLQLSRM